MSMGYLQEEDPLDRCLGQTSTTTMPCQDSLSQQSLFQVTA
jgi:hypothetical protein